MILHKHQVGCYEVANTYYDNKWDAMLRASELNSDYNWYFYSNVFDKIDWSIPIESSLDDLYLMRLKQLRNRYDHLILFFSGGRDSSNILLTAVNNNIQLDEIVVYYPFVMEKYFNNIETDSDNLYSEVEYAAKPLLKKLENKLTNTKIRFQDIGETTNRFTKNDDWFDRIRPANTLQMVSPSNGGACDDELLALALQGKNVGVIVGADKPTVYEMNGSYYFKFMDASFNAIPRPRSEEYKGFYNYINYEAFYQTPDLPHLVVKQAQVIANALEYDHRLKSLCGFDTSKLDRTIYDKYQISNISNKIISEKETILATYLYSDNHQPWQTLKHRKSLYRRGEKVVWETMSNSTKDNYMNTVNFICQKINPRFFIANDHVLGPKPIFSTPYFIKKAKIQ